MDGLPPARAPAWLPAFVAAVVGLLIAACGATPTGAPTPTAEPSAGQAVAVEGRFRLTFDLPRTTWAEGEAITGLATLELLGEGAAQLGGSGSGLFGFAFEEVGGRRKIEPAWTADCRAYQLDAGRPMTSTITKAGGFSADDPDAAFYEAFFRDPVLHLPAGTWRITAVASFIDGADCSGQSRDLRAPILVQVTASSA